MVVHFLQMQMLMLACLTCRYGYISILQPALLSFPFLSLPRYACILESKKKFEISPDKRTTFNSHLNHSRLLEARLCIVLQLSRLRDFRRFLGPRSLRINGLVFQVRVVSKRDLGREGLCVLTYPHRPPNLKPPAGKSMHATPLVSPKLTKS